MKVIIIGSAYPLRGGGISTFNERMARAFMEAGHQVKIYNFSLQYPNFLFPGKTQYSEEDPPEGLDIVTCINSVNPFNWIKVGNIIRKEHADLAIIRYWIPFMAPCLGTIARRLKKNRKTKVIAITDNVIPHERRPGDKVLTRYFLKPVDGFLVMSDSVLKDLELFDKKKPRKLSLHPLYDNFGTPVGMKEAREKLGLDPNGKYLLFFGLIRDYKGLDILLKALADERLKKAGVRLIVAGEFYDEYEKYTRLADELEVAHRVQMDNEFIPNSDVYLYFCASDIVVQPYKSATQSGVTQVAYHFNKPMIVTGVGALPQMVPDGKVGFVTEVDPGEIADAVHRFYNEDKEEEFTGNVKEEKRKYSWEKFVDAIGELYNDVR